MTSNENNTPRELLATCVTAAAHAAQIIRERTPDRGSLTWEHKSQFDFVSEVDRAAEGAISDIILQRHPDARMLGEELSPTMTDRSGVVFVADPLDGTTNFLHGLPWYAVSIAALVDDEIIAGAILHVPSGELFTATAGGGARLNGQPIAVSSITDPGKSLIGTGFPFKGDEHVDEYVLTLPRIMRETAGIRRPGAASLDLASVAAGRFGGFWELTLAPWDMAAGILLIREAGGIVTDLKGNPARVDHGGLVTGNPAIHEWLLRVLNNKRSQQRSSVVPVKSV